ncbi:MAG TPA: hypothetical protein VNZ61_00430 [Roseomonas sp.]|nr:hypothetical protein [Roseomonas sp.]
MSGFADAAYLQAPQEIGSRLAERLQASSETEFQKQLDQRLEAVWATLIDQGRSGPEAFLVCREVRQAAREEWMRIH